MEVYVVYFRTPDQSSNISIRRSISEAKECLRGKIRPFKSERLTKKLEKFLSKADAEIEQQGFAEIDLYSEQIWMKIEKQITEECSGEES